MYDIILILNVSGADVISGVVFLDVLRYTSALYIRQRKYHPIYLLRAANIYSICQTLRYPSSEHICVSGTVKQMQIRRYYCTFVSHRRAKHIKYLIPNWDTDRQRDDRVPHKYFFSMHVLSARVREFFAEKEMRFLEITIDYRLFKELRNVSRNLYTH